MPWTMQRACLTQDEPREHRGQQVCNFPPTYGAWRQSCMPWWVHPGEEPPWGEHQAMRPMALQMVEAPGQLGGVPVADPAKADQEPATRVSPLPSRVRQKRAKQPV